MQFTGEVSYKDEKFAYRIVANSERLSMTFSSSSRVLEFAGSGSDLNCPGLENIPLAIAPVVRTALSHPGQWQMIETLSVQQAATAPAAAAACAGAECSACFQYSSAVASAVRLVLEPCGLPEMQFELQEDLSRENPVEHLKRLKQQLEEEKQARTEAVAELKQVIEQRQQEAAVQWQHLQQEKQARMALETQLAQLVQQLQSSALAIVTNAGLKLPGSLGAQLVCRTAHPGTEDQSCLNFMWTETVHRDPAAPVAQRASDSSYFDVVRDCATLELQLRLHFTGAAVSEVVVWRSGTFPSVPAAKRTLYTVTIVLHSVKKGETLQVYARNASDRLVPFAAENWIAFSERS